MFILIRPTKWPTILAQNIGYEMLIFESFPEIEISNSELWNRKFWKCSFGTCFRIFCEFFACFRLWVLYKVNYCLPVRVGGRIFPPCWRGWIQFGAKFGIGLDLRIFKGFQDAFQNENVVHLLSIKDSHLTI